MAYVPVIQTLAYDEVTLEFCMNLSLDDYLKYNHLDQWLIKRKLLIFSCNQEGKTEAIANKKRAPIDKQRILFEQSK